MPYAVELKFNPQIRMKYLIKRSGSSLHDTYIFLLGVSVSNVRRTTSKDVTDLTKHSETTDKSNSSGSTTG